MKFFVYLVTALAVRGLAVSAAPVDGLASDPKAEPEAIGGRGCLCEGTKPPLLQLGMLRVTQNDIWDCSLSSFLS